MRCDAMRTRTRRIAAALDKRRTGRVALLEGQSLLWSRSPGNTDVLPLVRRFVVIGGSSFVRFNGGGRGHARSPMIVVWFAGAPALILHLLGLQLGRGKRTSYNRENDSR